MALPGKVGKNAPFNINITAAVIPPSPLLFDGISSRNAYSQVVVPTISGPPSPQPCHPCFHIPDFEVLVRGIESVHFNAKSLIFRTKVSS